MQASSSVKPPKFKKMVSVWTIETILKKKDNLFLKFNVSSYMYQNLLYQVKIKQKDILKKISNIKKYDIQQLFQWLRQNKQNSINLDFQQINGPILKLKLKDYQGKLVWVNFQLKKNVNQQQQSKISLLRQSKSYADRKQYSYSIIMRQLDEIQNSQQSIMLEKSQEYQSKINITLNQNNEFIDNLLLNNNNENPQNSLLSQNQKLKSQNNKLSKRVSQLQKQNQILKIKLQSAEKKLNQKDIQQSIKYDQIQIKKAQSEQILIQKQQQKKFGIKIKKCQSSVVDQNEQDKKIDMEQFYEQKLSKQKLQINQSNDYQKLKNSQFHNYNTPQPLPQQPKYQQSLILQKILQNSNLTPISVQQTNKFYQNCIFKPSPLMKHAYNDVQVQSINRIFEDDRLQLKKIIHLNNIVLKNIIIPQNLFQQTKDIDQFFIYDWSNIQSIKLDINNYGDYFFMKFTKRSWPYLTEISASYNDIHQIPHLQRLHLLYPNLKFMDLRCNPLTEHTRHALMCLNFNRQINTLVS